MKRHSAIPAMILLSLLCTGRSFAQCSGMNYWLNAPIATGTLNATGVIQAGDTVSVRSQGSFASGRPGYITNTVVYNGRNFGSIGLYRGSSFATGTRSAFKLKVPLDSNFIHVRVSDIRGDGFNAEPQRVQGFLNGVAVTATFTDPVNGAYITSGNIINGASSTSSLVQSAMRAMFNGPVDSIVVTATNLSDYVIIELMASCDLLLPADRVTLKATPTGAGNLIQWNAPGLSFKSFSIQRSPDGRNWSSPATLAAILTGGNGTYRYLDDSPLPATSHYRLLMTGWDGSSTYSPIVTVSRDPGSSARRLRAGPSPFRELLSLYCSETVSDIRCFRADGSLQALGLLRGAAGTRSIGTASWPPGIYVLLALFPDGGTETLRVIRQ